jgi:hypothetical protein
MRKVNRLVCLLLVFVLLACVAGTVQAATESLNVPAGEKVVKEISVSAEDHVHVSFTVLSRTPENMSFWLVFPDGTVKEYEASANYDISFVAAAKGNCTLHFDNTNSAVAQLVTLNYELEHYYFGIPEIPFLMLVIVVLLLCIVAGYIIMGKYAA